MAQLTIAIQSTGSVAAPRATRRRSMRTERMVSLRSTMPLGLVTLRHDIPEYLSETEQIKTEQTKTEYLKETTPKVDTAQRPERAAVETPVRKGGEAQW